MDWTILYRGPLSSCNYSCCYCPFAKRQNSPVELADDASRLQRFVQWALGRTEKIGVLFTPWGEALHHRAYQQAIITLSQAANLRKVAIQTNLSARLNWLAEANPGKAAIWATWHPLEVPMKRFLQQCERLDSMGIRYSVGIVGIRDHFEAIHAMRAALPPKTYLWINAFKDVGPYYQDEEIARLSAIDPHFPVNLQDHESKGWSCRAGISTFSVDGNGDMRRCHFIKSVIGNIYSANFTDVLRETPCSNTTCGCHIGYVHLDRLRQADIYGDGLLERIPQVWTQ